LTTKYLEQAEPEQCEPGGFGNK